MNDVLILAISVESSATLTSQDSVLNHFAAKYFDVKIKDNNQGISIEFGKSVNLAKAVGNESKGYINSSWRILTKNYRGSW